MTSPAIVALTQIMESLPEATQERVVVHLKEYLLEIEDELEWDALFKRMQPQLETAACRAREESTLGNSQPMDDDSLEVGNRRA